MKKLEVELQKNSKLIEKVASDLANNHAKILDDFLKVFVIANARNKTKKELKLVLNNIELVSYMEGTKMIYYFQPKTLI